jgi:preprotein translocase subunit YajC
MHPLIVSAILAASDGESQPSAGSSLFQLAFLPLLLVGLYFVMIRPNNRKRKEAIALQSALKVGDEVITASGIIGKITGEDGPTRFWLEIDDDVQVRIGRGFIQGRIAEDSTIDESDPVVADADAPAELTESTDSTDRD